MTLAHGDAALDIDAVLIVDDPVHDRFSNSTVFILCPVTVDTVIPIIRIILGTDDQGSFAAAHFNNLEQVVRFCFGQGP